MQNTGQTDLSPPWSDLNWLNDLIQYQFDIQFIPLLVSVLILIGWFALFRAQPALL
ncbi:MAG: hypothetical protein U0V48_13715 [Anaerolineales bacterium]